MKKISVLLIFLSIPLLCQSFPTAGKTFTIKYDPNEKDIFSDTSKLTLVYTFDCWHTKVDSIFRSEDLFHYVLNPQTGRKKEVLMTVNNHLFEKDIFIPDTAQLLSYYITNGTDFDYNDEKTYVSYIYNENGNPVRGARFRNADFMIMAGAEPKDYINELENELNLFPDNHLARFALWSRKIENENNFDTLISLKDDFENEFKELTTKFPNDYELLNSEARIFYTYNTCLNKFILPHTSYTFNKMFEIAKQIPDGKRDPIIERNYQMRLQAQKKFKTTSKDILEKPSINFDFTTIAEEKKKLTDYKGKIVLLDFWGTWCMPCVGEIPNLVKAYIKFKDKGFEIISISSDLIMNTKTEEGFKKFIINKKMEWTHVLDDKNKTIHNLYKIDHWPTLFLIDKNGNIIKDENSLRGAELEKTISEVIDSD